MASYAYIARSQQGEEMTGSLSVGSADEALAQLHQRGLVVLHLAEDRGAVGLRPRLGRFFAASFGKIKTRDLALFTRQLGTTLNAGIPLVRGLRGLAADSSNPVLNRAVSDIATRIERGENLSDAMAAHPECFGTMYVSMIRAGERAGTLDTILEDLATYHERMDAIQSKIRSALSYPLFVLIFAVAATAFLLLKIVPTFAEIYGDLGQKLPALTQIVVGASNSIRQNAIISLLTFVALSAALLLGLRTRSGRLVLDGLLLRVPGIGPIVQKAIMSRFARTFGILLRSGLPLLEGLEMVKGATGNVVVARAIESAGKKISAGGAVTSSFRSTGKFPEMILQLMSTGEEAGELDSMLMRGSEFYDRQVEGSVQSLTSLIEPVMIVVVGGLIGVIVVAMFLPIFYLGDAVMKGGFNF